MPVLLNEGKDRIIVALDTQKVPEVSRLVQLLAPHVGMFKAGFELTNAVGTAVRVRHIPTGEVVASQAERKQAQNKEIALQILRSRLYQRELEKQAAETAKSRSDQIGTGDRSEKIRTYNYPQDRLTDHRIKKNWHNLPVILAGNLDPIVKDLSDNLN